MSKHCTSDSDHCLDLNAPHEVNAAFKIIATYLKEVEELCNQKSYDVLDRACRSLDGLNYSHQNQIYRWSTRNKAESLRLKAIAKVDKIKSFEIGQLVKFKPNTSWDNKHDNTVWNIEHVIGVVKRRNKHTVSLKEISRRINGNGFEDMRCSGLNWKLNPDFDTFLDE